MAIRKKKLISRPAKSTSEKNFAVYLVQNFFFLPNWKGRMSQELRSNFYFTKKKMLSFGKLC